MTDDQMTYTFEGEDLEGLSAVERQFLVTTATEAGHGQSAISRMLKVVRQHFSMDVAFVSEFTEGRRVFRHVLAHGADAQLVAEGGFDPLEESFCQRVVDGRLPEVITDATVHPVASLHPATRGARVGGHLSVPVLLKSGAVYGTLCCFSHEAKPHLQESDAKTLKSVAKLVAAAIEDPNRMPGAAMSP
jgi:GAF domain-containing protein